MGQLEKYGEFRRTGKELNPKILKAIQTPEIMAAAGKLLGVMKDGQFSFRNEGEMDAFMDFLIHDLRINGENGIERFMQRHPDLIPSEREFLNAHLRAYTSLFDILSVSSDKATVLLQDILDEREPVELIDIGFSQSTSPGLLIFTRIVPVGKFNMTSGVAFVFSPQLEDRLIEKYDGLWKKTPPGERDAMRFALFFILNRAGGIEVQYRNPT